MKKYYESLKNAIKDLDYEVYDEEELQDYKYIKNRDCNVKAAYASLLYSQGKPAGLLCMEDCEAEHTLGERECTNYKLYGMVLAVYLAIEK